jgi:TRAP-type C4-dicarboxylate transport system permease small subunit
MITGLRRLSDIANRATEFALVPIVGSFTILLVVSVFSRYLFQLPIVTTIEMTRLAFVWGCFLGTAAGVKRGAHLRIVGLVSLAPARLQPLVPVLVHGSFLMFALMMVWHGWSLADRMFVTTFPTLGISQGWLYLAIPIAGVLITLHALSALLGREPAGQQPAIKGVAS